MKNFRIFAISALGAVALLAAGAARAENTISASYDVEMANVRVMEINHSVVLKDSGYEASFRAKTKGMLNFFSKIRLELHAKGSADRGILTPAAFDFNRKRNDDVNAYSLAWDGKGVATIVRDFKGEPLRRLKAALAEGSRDPLSILLESGLNGGKKPCSGTHRAYDGRDVYDLTFTVAELSDGGKTITCRVSAVSVAGKDFEKAYPDPVPASTYSAVLRAFTPAGAAKPLYLPYKIRGELEGKGFEAKLDSLSYDGVAAAFD